MPKLNKINEAFHKADAPPLTILDYIVEDIDLNEIYMTMQLYRDKEEARLIILREADIPKELLAPQPDAFHTDDEFSGFDFDTYFPAIVVYTFNTAKITQDDVCRAYIKHVQDFTV